MRDNATRRDWMRAIGVGTFGIIAGCSSGDSGGENTNGGDENDGEGSSDGGGNGGSGDENSGSDESTENTEEEPLTTVTVPPYEPFLIGETAEELSGFDVEMIESVIANAPGYSHDKWITVEDWPDEFFGAIEEGKADVATGAVTITDEREEKWDIRFTDPYFVINQAFLVRTDGDFKPEGPADLSGHTVGAQDGTTGAETVNGFISEGKLEEGSLKTFETADAAAKALGNGTVDAAVIDGPVAESYQNEMAVEIAFKHDTGEKYGFVVKSDRVDMLTALNTGIKQVRESGTYDELKSKYFG